jgi:hypothetical protein
VGHPFTYVSSYTEANNATGSPHYPRKTHRKKDAPEKKDAGFLVCTVSSIKAQKEERHRTTEGRRKKGEMVGSESADGQV